MNPQYEQNIINGKRIFFSHPEQYSESRMKAMKNDLKKIFGDAESDEAVNAFYHSVYDYWVYGNNIREDVFYKFAEKTEEEKEEYITFRNRFNYYRFLNNTTDELIFKKKYDTYERFKKWYGRDVIAINGEDDFEKFQNFVSKHNEFFVKPESLGLGIGVHKVKVDIDQDLKQVFGSLLEEGGISKKLAWSTSNQLVLEEPIIQSKEMGKFHPTSCNMIRITTVLVDNIVKYVDAWLRVGIKGSEIAAAADGEIYCGVNLDTGVVDTKGYTEFGDVFDIHPDTGVPFAGSIIPRWNEMMDMAKELATVVPTVRYVGWDLALTDNGWKIIEGNENGEFLGQLIYGKPYRRRFEDLIKYNVNFAN